MRSWKMHAADFGDHFEHFGNSPFYASAFGTGKPIVEVNLTENPQGEYWGWLDSESERTEIDIKQGRPNLPANVYHRHVLFEICFPYGSQAEVDAGKGEILRLSVSKA